MASSAGAVRAGGAFIEIFAKDGAFQQAMTRVSNKLKAIGASVRTFGAGLMGIGMAIVSPIVASAKAFASVGSALNDMSARTGVATEALSVLKFAAEQTGTDMAGVETAVKKMQKAIFAAGTGSKEAAEALAMVGLTAQDLAGLSADEQMGKIADGLMAIEDPGTRAAVAMAIFGKSGTAILPMLEGGSAGMSRFAAEAKRLGLVMDGETAAKADALGDAMDKLKAAMMMAFIQVGSAVAPILTAIAEKLATGAAAVGNFIRENQQLVVTALKVAAGVVAFGAALYGIGAAIGFASQAIKIFQSVLQFLPALFSPIGLAAMAAFAAVAGGIVIARQLSPAFRKETDAIMTALGQLDFATAWEIMNLNFAIALTKMAGSASIIFGQIKGFVAATAAFIGDKLTEGLDRFMGLFGADVITMQNAWERLGIYFRAAFDWDFAMNGMSAALAKADQEAEKARGRAPTADARAEDRASQRQADADARQAQLQKDTQGFSDTIDALTEDLDRAHDRLKPKTEGTPEAAPGTPGRPDMGVMPVGSGEAATAAARSGIGQTMGSFASSAEGMGIGPELNKLEDPTKQTAENTLRTATALERITNAPSPAGGGVAAEVGVPKATAMAPQVQAGVKSTDWSSFAKNMNDGFRQVVEAINANTAATTAQNPLLSRIAEAVVRSGATFA